MSLAQLTNATDSPGPAVTAALRRLAFAGQVIHDLPRGVYRFRQVMPMALGEAQLGPENPELNAARHLMLTRDSTLETADCTDRGVVCIGRVESTPVEILVDLDGRIRRGKCLCGHFRQYGIRNGPCRHMIVLRCLSTASYSAGSLKSNGYASHN